VPVISDPKLIKQYVTEHPGADVYEISEATGIQSGICSSRLSEMVRNNQIESTRRGRASVYRTPRKTALDYLDEYRRSTA